MQVLFHMLGVSFIPVAGLMWLENTGTGWREGRLQSGSRISRGLKVIWSGLA
ncbi:MAG: hypothetical protein CM1200mP34_0700 [Verrucomicrobiales bacterium]|nr:MAG: hypothetical protein CM1200mP34_0700 [Verrucomicrobiales bacterium]